MTFLRNFMALARPYWTGEEKRFAWLISAVATVLNVFQIYVLTVLTYWQGEQGDSFQEKNVTKFSRS